MNRHLAPNKYIVVTRLGTLLPEQIPLRRPAERYCSVHNGRTTVLLSSGLTLAASPSVSVYSLSSASFSEKMDERKLETCKSGQTAAASCGSEASSSDESVPSKKRRNEAGEGSVSHVPWLLRYIKFISYFNVSSNIIRAIIRKKQWHAAFLYLIAVFCYLSALCV